MNEGADSAPSKRIMSCYPQYAKTVHGPIVVADAGLGPIRKVCPHLDSWLLEIEARCLIGTA